MTALYITTASRLVSSIQTLFIAIFSDHKLPDYSSVRHGTALIGMRGRSLSCAGLRQTITVILRTSITDCRPNGIYIFKIYIYIYIYTSRCILGLLLNSSQCRDREMQEILCVMTEMSIRVKQHKCEPK